MILSEIRSVFSSAMGDKEDFSFEILQAAGGGVKSLVIPCTSAAFTWSAKQIISSSGRGYIYILAKEELFFPKEEIETKVC